MPNLRVVTNLEIAEQIVQNHTLGAGFRPAADRRIVGVITAALDAKDAEAARLRAENKRLVRRVETMRVMAEELLAWRACNEAFMVRAETDHESELAVEAEECSHEVDEHLAKIGTDLAALAGEGGGE